MKLLVNKTNTAAADAVYLYGNMVDETGSDNGNRVDRDFMTDYVQLMERIFNESGITANGLNDNVTNGWQLYEAFRLITKPYKVYAATMDQPAAAAPTATVLGNNEIGTIVWTKTANGDFLGTLVGAFTANKTWAITGQEANSMIYLNRLGNDTIQLVTTNTAGTFTDGILSDTPIEIRAYD